MLNDTHSELCLEDAAQGLANRALHSDDAEKWITELYIEARARGHLEDITPVLSCLSAMSS